MIRHTIFAVLPLTLLTACAGTGGGLGSVAKSNQVALGMKPAAVKAILGDPSQTQFVSDKWV